MRSSSQANRTDFAGDADGVSVDPGKFRHVLGHYPTGVVVVSAIGADGAPAGMAVGTFTSVSLNPPLVGFLPSKESRSWSVIQTAGRFCVNVLAADQHDLCSRFSSRNGQKFEGLDYVLSEGGSPILPDVVGWIDCTVHDVIEAGDHYFVLGRVIGLEVGRTVDPMLFCRGALRGAATASASAG